MIPSITVDTSSGHPRLKYFHRSGADPDYWDNLWLTEAHRERYARAESGALPWFLRGPVKRHLKPGGRVLEAGCGQAHFTVAMAARGYRAEGVDFAPQVVERLSSRFPQLRFWVGDVRSLAVASDSYDAVYSPGVCEHFSEGPDAVLGETFRVLRPGGIALISTPVFNPVRATLARLGAFRRPPEAADEFYQYAFSPTEMEAILGRLGFHVLEARCHGALKTLRDHVPLLERVPLGPLGKPFAVALDTSPITRHWGHACVWVARK